MSMQPQPWPEVPELTARVAKAAFPKGNLAIRIRDELGEVYADGRFASAFGVRGRPGISPGQLMMATVLQFTENLTDRQAADAVRDRMSWKYALGLELDDAGFDSTVFSEFRTRLVEHKLSGVALDLLLQRLGGLGLVAAGGRQRTDSTHVLARIRSLNRLELAGETMRSVLEALAAAAPGWLAAHIDPDWVKRYGARVDSYRLPESETKRTALAVQIGRDGYALMRAVTGADAPAWLSELPALDTLRQVWVQQYYRSTGHGREVVSRRQAEVQGLPPGRFRLISPYDTDARYSIKREHGWAGYKVHFSETCDGADSDPPSLITNVATTPATVPDVMMTEAIHQQLAASDLTPGEHLLDSGYPSAELILASRRDFGIRLVTPVLLDHSAQAKAGTGYDKSAFTINWDTQQVTCPQGASSASWTPCSQRGQDAIVVRFSTEDCQRCPVRAQCTRATRSGRQLSLRSRELHEVMIQARSEQSSEQWKASYAARAGVEGTMHQAAKATGVRHARYLGLAKTSLEHNIAATAINLIRLDAHFTGKPTDRGRTSHLARLDFTLAA